MNSSTLILEQDLPADFKAMLSKLSSADKLEALEAFAAAQRAEEKAALRILEKKKVEERSKIGGNSVTQYVFYT